MQNGIFGPVAATRRQAIAGVSADATGDTRGAGWPSGRCDNQLDAPAAKPGTTSTDRAVEETPFETGLACVGLLVALLTATGWPLAWLSWLVEAVR